MMSLLTFVPYHEKTNNVVAGHVQHKRSCTSTVHMYFARCNFGNF